MFRWFGLLRRGPGLTDIAAVKRPKSWPSIVEKQLSITVKGFNGLSDITFLSTRHEQIQLFSVYVSEYALTLLTFPLIFA